MNKMWITNKIIIVSIGKVDYNRNNRPECRRTDGRNDGACESGRGIVPLIFWESEHIELADNELTWDRGSRLSSSFASNSLACARDRTWWTFYDLSSFICPRPIVRGGEMARRGNNDAKLNERETRRGYIERYIVDTATTLSVCTRWIIRSVSFHESMAAVPASRPVVSSEQA